MSDAGSAGDKAVAVGPEVFRAGGSDGFGGTGVAAGPVPLRGGPMHFRSSS